MYVCVCVFHTYTSNYNNNGGRDLDEVSEGDMWIHKSEVNTNIFCVVAGVKATEDVALEVWLELRWWREKRQTDRKKFPAT